MLYSCIDAEHRQSVLYHATLWFQDIQQTGPIGAMVRFLPTSVWGVLCNVIVAYLIASVPTQWLVCSGIVATGYVELACPLKHR